jgi:hypothetical protein
MEIGGSIGSIIISFDEIHKLITAITHETTEIFAEYSGADGPFPRIICDDRVKLTKIFVNEVASWGLPVITSKGITLQTRNFRDRANISFMFDRFYIYFLNEIILRKELINIFIEEKITTLKKWIHNKTVLISSLISPPNDVHIPDSDDDLSDDDEYKETDSETND